MKNEKLLLHCCCAPCSTVAFERLLPQYQTTAYYYNPNIYPKTEYIKRYQDLERYTALKEVSVVLGMYETANWSKEVEEPDHEERFIEGGERCQHCYRFRLSETAKKAVAEGYQWFGTTLTVSPHKDSAVINAIGQDIAKQYGVSFMDIDLKENKGYHRSILLSKEAGLYRQKYCGCQKSLLNSARA